MHKNLKYFLTLLGQYVVFWIIALALFSIFRFYGLHQQEGISIDVGSESALKFKNVLFIFSLFGLLVGIANAIVHYFFEQVSSKRLSLGLKLLLTNFVYLISLVIIATIIMEISNRLFDVNFERERGWWVKDKVFWAVGVYMAIASLVFSFIGIANDKFGKGVFLKMLLGKYKEPKEEKRIFMFLDLKSSTTYAEQLGHLRYSKIVFSI